jgi:hypothetical protein
MRKMRSVSAIFSSKPNTCTTLIARFLMSRIYVSCGYTSVIDCVVAIERVGPAADGHCYTMKGLSMNHLAAPLELLLISPPEVDEEEDGGVGRGGACCSVSLTSQTEKEEPEEGRRRKRPAVPPQVPASVLSLEAAAASAASSVEVTPAAAAAAQQVSEEERAALLALLESDVELTDAQFEALALLAPPPPPPVATEDEDDVEDPVDSKQEVQEDVEVRFETVSYDYRRDDGMSMEEMMAELPPAPKSSTATADPTGKSLHLDSDLVHADAQHHAFNTSITSIGIGDGGNEVGMGKISSLVQSSPIPNAATIACVIPTDHLHVASVSNWGGYALAAAVVAILVHEGDAIAREMNSSEQSSKRSCLSNKDSSSDMNILNIGGIVDNLSTSCAPPAAPSFLSPEVLSKLSTAEERGVYLRGHFLPSGEQQLRACEGLVEAGARDGISGEGGLSVDGMPLETSLRVLEEINDIVIASLGSMLPL